MCIASGIPASLTLSPHSTLFVCGVNCAQQLKKGGLHPDCTWLRGYVGYTLASGLRGACGWFPQTMVA